MSLETARAAALWVPLSFAGFSGPGWEGFQLDLGLADALANVGAFADTDEARGALFELRESYQDARREHADSLTIDTLADDQLPLPEIGPKRQGQGRHEHPPPSLDELLLALRPSGTQKRFPAEDGRPEATDNEAAQMIGWIYRHRGRNGGLTENDLAWQREWTEARALSAGFFFRRNRSADRMPAAR